jgi:hypothetical protein
VVSFLVLLALLSGRIKMFDKTTDKEIPMTPVIKVALSIWWPIFLYIIIRGAKELNNDE